MKDSFDTDHELGHGTWRIAAAVTAICIVMSPDAFSPAQAAAPTYSWSHAFGDATESQVGHDVAVDPFGNIVLVGYFAGIVDFGGGPMVCDCAGGWNSFIAKFDQAGQYTWAKQLSGSGDVIVLRVAVNSAGEILIAGSFIGSMNIDGHVLAGHGDEDVFLAKLDQSGNHVWSRSFGDSDRERALGLVVDSFGNVVFVGFFRNTIDFGGGALSSAGGSDAFLAKLDATGEHLWSRAFGSVYQELAHGVAVDPAGDVLFASTMQGDVDLGGGALSAASPGSNDVVVAKFTSTGAHSWSRRYGDADQQSVYDIATDMSGNAFITGSLRGTIDFGGGAISEAGGSDIFLAKLSSGGAHQWSRAFGDANLQTVARLAADPFGGVVLCGSAYGSVDFGGGVLQDGGGEDIVVAAFSTIGGHEWSMRFGDAEQQQGLSVAVGIDGSVVLSAQFFGGIDFGGGPVVSSGVWDIALAKFGNLPVPVERKTLGGVKALYRKK